MNIFVGFTLFSLFLLNSNWTEALLIAAIAYIFLNHKVYESISRQIIE